jgi:hypothetical protein
MRRRTGESSSESGGGAELGVAMITFLHPLVPLRASYYTA